MSEIHASIEYTENGVKVTSPLADECLNKIAAILLKTVDDIANDDRLDKCAPCIGKWLAAVPLTTLTFSGNDYLMSRILLLDGGRTQTHCCTNYDAGLQRLSQIQASYCHCLIIIPVHH